VTEINETLDDSPESVNQDPYGDGWMVKVSVSEAGELDNLMSAVQYQEMI
jgi:glycine cleavage system H protein|tara:strand:+ start:692 stop:841 length:150 start_codon:yes stop_codon:yes gene_type:complete